jgi:hypothetical protein
MKPTPESNIEQQMAVTAAGIGQKVTTIYGSKERYTNVYAPFVFKSIVSSAALSYNENLCRMR